MSGRFSSATATAGIGAVSKLSQTRVSDRPGGVAHAFSVLCRAFQPDISESIVNSFPGQSAGPTEGRDFDSPLWPQSVETVVAAASGRKLATCAPQFPWRVSFAGSPCGDGPATRRGKVSNRPSHSIPANCPIYPSPPPSRPSRERHGVESFCDNTDLGTCRFSPLFSPRGEAKCVRGPSVEGARRSARLF